MKFHGYVEGFSGQFDSLEALRAWVNGLIAKYPYLIGKTLKIAKAVWVAKDGSGAEYSLKPSHYREIVIGE